VIYFLCDCYGGCYKKTLRRERNRNDGKEEVCHSCNIQSFLARCTNTAKANTFLEADMFSAVVKALRDFSLRDTDASFGVMCSCFYCFSGVCAVLLNVVL